MKLILLLSLFVISISNLKAADDPIGAIDSSYLYLRTKYYEGKWSTWAGIPEYVSDDAVVVGNGPTDRPEYHAIGNYEINDSNFALLELWNRDYHALHFVNRAINLIGTGSNEQLAEMYFLRAYYHFEMLRFFGEIPIHTQVIPLNKYMQKSSIAGIFASVTQDLNLASALLPQKSERSTDEKGKPTKGAALALLGKVYLYMASPYYNQGTNYYDSAAGKLQLVINSGEYAMESQYSNIWRLEHELGTESIFEIEYEGAPSTVTYWSDGFGAPSNIDVQLNAPRLASLGDSINPGWQMEMLSQNLADAYNSTGDSVRKHGTILAEWQINQIGNSIPAEFKVENYTGYYTAKRAAWKYINPFRGSWSYPTNERIIRYADVLLMAAEALNRKQSPEDPTALEYLNMVRARAGLYVTANTGNQLYSDIKNERRLELADEGQRFFDLVRWNDASTKLGSLGFTAGVNEHFPIPYQAVMGSYTSLNKINSDAAFLIYPTPSDGMIYIQNAEHVIVSKVEIFNVLGVNVYTQNIEKQLDVIRMDLSSLNKGNYFVKISGEASSSFEKIILK